MGLALSTKLSQGCPAPFLPCAAAKRSLDQRKEGFSPGDIADKTYGQVNSEDRGKKQRSIDCAGEVEQRAEKADGESTSQERDLRGEGMTDVGWRRKTVKGPPTSDGQTGHEEEEEEVGVDSPLCGPLAVSRKNPSARVEFENAKKDAADASSLDPDGKKSHKEASVREHHDHGRHPHVKFLTEARELIRRKREEREKHLQKERREALRSAGPLGFLLCRLEAEERHLNEEGKRHTAKMPNSREADRRPGGREGVQEEKEDKHIRGEDQEDDLRPLPLSSSHPSCFSSPFPRPTGSAPTRDVAATVADVSGGPPPRGIVLCRPFFLFLVFACHLRVCGARRKLLPL